MRYRRRLRSRIILSFFLFGSLLTAAFALSAVLLRGYLEDQLIGRQLSFELESHARALERDPDAQPAFSRIEGFSFSERKRANVPLKWRDLADGVYTITDDAQSGGPVAYKLAVRKTSGTWYFLQYDISHELRLRNRLTWGLVIVVIVFSGLSALIAFWSASRVMRPVADLAARLSKFGKGGGPEELAPHFADDEVGQLAATLDDYASKLTELVIRDREFNADVSHELRTPIAVIRGAAELLLAQNDLPEKTRHRLLRIDRAARQSNELIEALLLLSRNERQPPAHTEATNVVAVVDQVVETQRAQIGSKSIDLKVLRVGGDAAMVDAPAAVLSVALANLVGNAIRYTPQGEIRVIVEANGVRVEDEGPGIDAKDAERLFERGVRGDGAGGKGAGLGLAIVKRLCDLYGWTVTLAPGETHGAVATLRFA
ncbi:MAG TPA: HAMP domain-containing sensor histidine kinase [Pseudomonadota bacterium]|nr:HAMP domain-containing histidine kinase [Xanthomonadales bacterium]HQW81217.1 HAMP domain-containing sensor histidine kinase [Pseudomonadota bacterium]